MNECLIYQRGEAGRNKDTIIPLTNKQINFYPKRNLKVYFIYSLGIPLIAIIFVYLFSPQLFNLKLPETFDLFKLIYVLMVLLLFFLTLITEKLNNHVNHPAKIDSTGKTREDKVREFWEKVLVSEDEIFIERSVTKVEKYAVQRLPAEFVETEELTMTWRDIVLFTKSSDGNSSRLEGMPSVLILKN